MPSAAILAESQSFSPTARLELWKLDGSAIGWDTPFYFVNCSNERFGPVVFNGQSYTPFPVMVEGVGSDGKGGLDRPKLTVSNINGYISVLLKANGPLDGATVTRTRVYARYIDAVNFPANQPLPRWLTPDPTATYAPESWQINRKVKEDPQSVVQFELAAPNETQGKVLPTRTIIANVCTFKYRDPKTCQYSGVPVADGANRLFTTYYGLALSNRGNYDNTATYNRGDYVTTYSLIPQYADIPIVWVCIVNGTTGSEPTGSNGSWVQDSCPRTIAACKLRFTTSPLRTSAFIGVSRAGWIARA